MSLRSASLAWTGLVVGRGACRVTAPDLDLAPGMRLSVLGPNGAGKTTLLKTVAGLIPPVAGAVRIGGRPLEALDAAGRARAVAYAPPPGEVSAGFTVLDMVLMPVRVRGRARPEDFEAARDHLAAVGADGLAHRAFDRLSSGERPRVLIARALMQGAEVCLFDEPTATLDPAARDRVEAALAALTDQGRIVVVASHDRTLLTQGDACLAVAAGRAVRLETADLDDAEMMATVFGGARLR